MEAPFGIDVSHAPLRLSFSYASYLPFIIWWDPSPEWFIIPNLFLGAFLVYALGALDRRFAVATLTAGISIMAAVNFNSTIGPRRMAASPALTLAKCVVVKHHFRPRVGGRLELPQCCRPAA